MLRSALETVRRHLYERSLRHIDEPYFPVGFVEHEPGLVTGLADGDGDQTEAIGRLVQAADVWTWV